MFAHQFSKESFKFSPPEQNTGERLIEKAGYIPAQQRIENLILAGQRLSDFRKEQFDFHEQKDIDENFYDSTRNKNYDLADAFQDSLRVEENIKQATEEAKRIRKDALETLQTAPEAPGEPLEPKNDPE